MDKASAATASTGKKDYGHFDTFVEKVPGQFQITGDMGEFVVHSEIPIVKLIPDAT